MDVSNVSSKKIVGMVVPGASASREKIPLPLSEKAPCAPCRIAAYVTWASVS